MKTEDFNILVNRRVAKTKKVLVVKGAEYTTSDDERFQAFIDGAEVNRCTPAMYAFALVTKHFLSLRDFVIFREGDITPKIIDDKLGDIIVYMHLLEGILSEKL
jgi:hypothetical protein